MPDIQVDYTILHEVDSKPCPYSNYLNCCHEGADLWVITDDPNEAEDVPLDADGDEIDRDMRTMSWEGWVKLAHEILARDVSRMIVRDIGRRIGDAS